MRRLYKKAADYGRRTKRYLIALCVEAGMTKRETYNHLKPQVLRQEKPMVFSYNRPGGRVPKPMHLQLVELKNEIGRVYAEMGRAVGHEFEAEETPQAEEIQPPVETPTPDAVEEQEAEGIEEDSPEVPAVISPVAKGKRKIKEEIAYFVRRVREIRAFCKRGEELGEVVVDDLETMRPVEAANRLIPHGIPADALLHSMTLHWGADSREQAGIAHYDVAALSREIMVRRDIDPAGKHRLFGYLLTLAEQRQPIFLVGPKGTGKSFIAKQLADYMKLDYGETPISSGATRGDVLGRFTANPERAFIAARFNQLFGNGGLFNIEELDAGDPGMLIVLNNALANDVFYNSSSGEIVYKSPDFVALATGNTFGLGANTKYTARERLDDATLDRWRMGRCWVDLDEAVEDLIAFRGIA